MRTIFLDVHVPRVSAPTRLAPDRRCSFAADNTIAFAHPHFSRYVLDFYLPIKAFRRNANRFLSARIFGFPPWASTSSSRDPVFLVITSHFISVCETA